MVVPIALWATRTGHRFTSAADSLSIDVESNTNKAATGGGGEGGIASVVFTINGVAQPAITQEATRRPNYAETRDPLTGTMTSASIEAWGMNLNAADWPNGTITITAVATTTAGSTTTLPAIKVYNNKTSDTRPSSKVIYVSPSGDNSNNGLTTGTPVLAIQKACELAATTRNLGGAEIVLMPGVHQWCGYSFGMDTNLHTSDHWWFRIRVQDGAEIVRNGTMTSNGNISWGQDDDTLRLEPDTGAGDEDNVRVLLVMEGDTAKAMTKGDLRIQTGLATTAFLYAEGGVFGHPRHSSSTRPWSIRFTEEKVRLFEHVRTGGNGGDGELGATNVRAEGTDDAFIGFTFVQNCHVKDWTGITLQSVSGKPVYYVSNLLVERMRYNYEVAGLIDCEIDSGVTLEVIDANNVRIQQAFTSDVNPLADFGNPDESVQMDNLHLWGLELLGSSLWGLAIMDGPSTSDVQSGSLGVEVTAAAVNGTGPYIDVAWPSHGYGADFSLAGWRLRAANRLRDANNGTTGPTYFYKSQVHPDVWQFLNETTDSVIHGVRIEDCEGLRPWAASTAAMRRISFRNCGDTSFGENHDLNPTAMEDVLFEHMTFGANANFGSITPTGICEVRWCVFQNLNNAPQGAAITFDGNHFVDAADAIGTNTRTGAFFANDPTIDPWDMSPSVANQGQGAGAPIHFPAADTFPSAGGAASIGAWPNVAVGFGGPSGIAGSAAIVMGTPTAAASGTLGAGITGTAAATLVIAASGMGALGSGNSGTAAAVFSLGDLEATGELVETTERTHYYHIAGDAHIRGIGQGGPEIMNPGTPSQSLGEQRITLLAPPAGAAIKIGDVIRGNTSKAGIMVTRVVSTNEVIGEPLPADVAAPFNVPGGAFSPATAALPFSGETVTITSSGPVTRTGQISFAANGQALPDFLQFIGETADEELGALTPGDGAYGTYWYRNTKAARIVEVSGVTGGFVKGDHITTSGGGTAIIKLVIGTSLRLAQLTGSWVAGQTVTNDTSAGSATIDSVGAEAPTGGWWPFSLFPNLRNLGTYFEFQPQGNDAGGRTPRIGVEARFLPRAEAHHRDTPNLADRGVKLISFDTADAQPQDGSSAIEGGVIIQIVQCTGTVPATWDIGERLTSTTSDWEGTLHGYNATTGKLFVRDVNGEVLATGTVTGSASGSTATNDGSAWGWQKGSRHFEAWKSTVEEAMSAAGGRYLEAPIKHEGVAFMPWETEIRPFIASYACPFPTKEQAGSAFARCIASMREFLGDNTESVPFVLWMHRLESQPGAYIPSPLGNIPVAFLLRDWIGGVPGLVKNCTVVDSHTIGAEMAPGGLFLRTMDYPNLIGEALWRHLRFGQVTVPQGTGYELLPVGVHTGQSRQTGFVGPGLAAFGDPELFPKQDFGPGVSSVDSNSLVWNPITRRIEPAAMGINLNGFWGSNSGLSGPEVPVQARMKMRFSDSAKQSSKFCLFKVPISGSCKNADVIDAAACQDPELTSRPSIGPTCTVTVIAAGGGLPARGRFTAAPGTFTVPFWQVGMSSTIAGSAGNLTQGGGGNNTPPFSVNQVHAIADDGSWIEFRGSFVAEGPRSFTLHAGPPPAWAAIESEWNQFLAEAHANGYLPVPVYIWDDQSDSDILEAEGYAAAMDRWWEAAETLFGAKLKGAQPIAKLITMHPETAPWGTDEQVATIRAAQAAKAASLTNCATIEISDLPFEIDNGNVIRLTRQDNGVHLAPLGTITHGFRADQALGQFGALKGIPEHPNGELAATGFGSVNGGVTAQTNTAAATTETAAATDSGGDSAGELTPAGLSALSTGDADSLLSAIEESWRTGSSVLSYTINGQTVTRNAPAQMIELHRYLTSLKQQSAGIRRTVARFD